MTDEKDIEFRAKNFYGDSINVVNKNKSTIRTIKMNTTTTRFNTKLLACMHLHYS